MWATWKVWTSFTSKYYFFELGSYTGRMLANLYALVNWLVNFNQVLAGRRVRAAIANQGTTRPTSFDQVVTVVEVKNEPLKPTDDVYVDDQIW